MKSTDWLLRNGRRIDTRAATVALTRQGAPDLYVERCNRDAFKTLWEMAGGILDAGMTATHPTGGLKWTN